MVRTRVALVLCTLLVGGLFAPARAADPDSETLTPDPGIVTWSGSFDRWRVSRGQRRIDHHLLAGRPVTAVDSDEAAAACAS